jgi:hypothetical protein
VSCGDGAVCEGLSGAVAEALLGEGVLALVDPPLFIELQADRLAAARAATAAPRRIFRMAFSLPFRRPDCRRRDQPQGVERRSLCPEMA